MALYITLLDKDNREIRFSCGPDQTIADAAEDAGLRLISCASGYCGACAAQLITGETIPSTGSSSQNAAGDLLLCRQRAKSDLVVKPRFGWIKTG